MTRIPAVLRGVLLLGLLVLVRPDSTSGHEIPNERVDRLLQATLGPGRLLIEYEVSLSEFTLLLDLRRLDEPRQPVERGDDLWERYGRLTAPLNASGLLVRLNDAEVELELDDLRWRVEDHLIYTFTYSATLPEQGRLLVRDTNYLSSPGTGRVGARIEPGVAALSDPPAPDARQLEPRPRWMLSDAEERNTREFLLDYTTETRPSENQEALDEQAQEANRPVSSRGEAGLALPARGFDFAGRLRDLETDSPWAWVASWLVAVLLGAGHAVQPGHGKLVIASAAAPGRASGTGRAFPIALLAAMTHLASVVMLAVVLWATRGWRFDRLDHLLKLGAGLLLALLGAYRLGSFFAGPVQTLREPSEVNRVDPRATGWWMAGIAAGLIPCWDAVLLVLITEAQGRLALGLWLLTGFSLGLLLVQFGVAALAGQVGPRLETRFTTRLASRYLGLASALVLAGIGLFLLLS